MFTVAIMARNGSSHREIAAINASSADTIACREAAALKRTAAGRSVTCNGRGPPPLREGFVRFGEGEDRDLDVAEWPDTDWIADLVAERLAEGGML